MNQKEQERYTGSMHRIRSRNIVLKRLLDVFPMDANDQLRSSVDRPEDGFLALDQRFKAMLEPRLDHTNFFRRQPPKKLLLVVVAAALSPPRNIVKIFFQV